MIWKKYLPIITLDYELISHGKEKCCSSAKVWGGEFFWLLLLLQFNWNAWNEFKSVLAKIETFHVIYIIACASYSYRRYEYHLSRSLSHTTHTYNSTYQIAWIMFHTIFKVQYSKCNGTTLAMKNINFVHWNNFMIALISAMIHW